MTTEAAKARVQASEELAEWLDRHGKSRSWLARILEVSPQAVGQWCSGVRRPEAALREAVEAITGIPTTSWLTQEENDSLQAALARTNGPTDKTEERP